MTCFNQEHEIQAGEPELRRQKAGGIVIEIIPVRKKRWCYVVHLHLHLHLQVVLAQKQKVECVGVALCAVIGGCACGALNMQTSNVGVSGCACTLHN